MTPAMAGMQKPQQGHHSREKSNNRENCNSRDASKSRDPAKVGSPVTAVIPVAEIQATSVTVENAGTTEVQTAILNWHHQGQHQLQDTVNSKL